MITKQKKLQLGLWMGLILLIAGFIRFYQLGSLSLDNREAQVALEAYRQERIVTDPLPVIVNTVIFWMLGSSNGVARFLPALMGSLFVLLPLLFVKSLGTRGVLLLSAGLALEPSLVALSRMLDGRILGIVFFCFTVGFFVQKKFIPSGISLGLFLLSGRSVAYPLTLLIVVVLWTWLSDRDHAKDVLVQWQSSIPPNGVKHFLIALLLTFVIAGSAYGLRLTGISAAFTSWIAFFQAWVLPQDHASLAQIGITLLAYELFPLIFGTWGVIESMRRGQTTEGIMMLRWLVISLLLVLVFPGRQSVDLVWVLLPLWWFAAQHFAQFLDAYKEIDWLTLAASLFLFVLMCFLVLNWASAVNVEYDPQKVLLRWAVIGGTFILLLLVFVLIAYGWGVRTSIISATAALSVFLVIFQLLGGAWKSTGLNRGGMQMELWRMDSYPQQFDLMIETLDQLGEFKHGAPQFLEVIQVGKEEPAMDWAFRHYSYKSVETLNPGDSPEVVISNKIEGENWGDEYRGQDFVTNETVSWSLMYPNEWQQWLLHRKAPVQQEWTILWARTDLFPGSDTIGTGE